MRETRSSGSVEGVVGNHDSYSDLSFEIHRRVTTLSPDRAGILCASFQQLIVSYLALSRLVQSQPWILLFAFLVV